MSAAELFVWLVSGLHCEADTVKEEMQATKELWGIFYVIEIHIYYNTLYLYLSLQYVF